MSQTLQPRKKQTPPAFQQYNETQSQRTVRLTRQALDKLQADDQTVTLAALAEATRKVDEGGKGLTSTTILRNPAAAALFRQHSPAYQARQQAQGTNRPAENEAEISTVYRNLSPAALVRLIEALKKQVTDLKTQRRQLKAERDEAYRLRDEALRQNTQQLVRLTQLMTQLGERDD